MSVMSDKWIKRMALEQQMIHPFQPEQVRYINTIRFGSNETEVSTRNVISFGTSSYGYDICVGSKFKVFTNLFTTVVDPKAFDDRSFIEYDAEKEGKDHIIIPPNSFVLGMSVEYFKIPRDILTICLGKSTYARCGIIVNVTPFEPGWEGQATLEFSNSTTLPAKVYANEGAAQVIFLQGNEPCEVSYADRKGKYQGQIGVVPPRL